MKTGYVYKLCCNDVNISDIYVGSTANMKERKKQHRRICNNLTHPNGKYKVYDCIRANGGFDNWSMVMVETVEYDDKKQLHARERFHLEELKASLNCVIPTRTDKEYRDTHKEHYKEWYEANKDAITQKNKEYHEAHKEYFKQCKKEYYEAHKDAISQKYKVYREANKDTIKARKAKYREENKELINQKDRERYIANKDILYQRHNKWREANKDAIKERNNVKHNCECGGRYTHSNKVRHMKSKRHIDSLATIAQTPT